MNVAVVLLVIHLFLYWSSLHIVPGHAAQWPVAIVGIVSACAGAMLWWRVPSPSPMHTRSKRMGLAAHVAGALVPLLWHLPSPYIWALSATLLLPIGAILWAQRHVLTHHPVLLPAQHLKRVTLTAISMSLIGAIALPLFVLAARVNTTHDMTFTQQGTASETTHRLIKQLNQPQGSRVSIRVFMSQQSEITPAVMTYFKSLSSDSTRVESLDQASNPMLARQLNVRDNGVITITVEGPSYKGGLARWTRRLDIGQQWSEARLRLRRLDELVQSRLRDLTQGERKIYLLSGHDEYSWKETAEHRRLALMYRIGTDILTSAMTTLDAATVISEGVPSDASAVFVIGPQRPFAPEEVSALRRYIANGGAMLIALDPTLSLRTQNQGVRKSLEPLLSELGVVLGDRPIASKVNIVPMTQSRADRYTMVIKDITAHPSTMGIKQSGNMALLVSGASTIEQLPSSTTARTIIARSHPQSWLDTDLDFEQSQTPGERARRHQLIMAVEGKGRVMLTSDATMWTDMLMGRSPGNQQFYQDTVHWLYRREALAGAANARKDVRILHTKSTQQIWFYGTVIVVPLAVFCLGLWWTRRRRLEPEVAS